MLKESDPNVKVVLGGAPVTKDVAKLFGADGYADDAAGAVKEMDRIVAAL
jgi:methanogenic corrinoid protein MtbC1